MTDQARRQAAHEAVDRMLDAEELIAKTPHPYDCEQIAMARSEDYRLNLRFPLLEKYAMAAQVPAEVNPYDTEESKRAMFAEAIYSGIPFAESDALELRNGLRALNSGQTMKIFEPTKNSSRIKSYQIRELQLYAVMGSYFLHGMGITKKRSRDIVAEIYGLSSGENIRTWERRDLTESVGEEEQEADKDMYFIAQQSGELFSSGSPQPPGSMVVFGSKENALKKMKACAKAYRGALDYEEIEMPEIMFSHYKRKPV